MTVAGGKFNFEEAETPVAREGGDGGLEKDWVLCDGGGGRSGWVSCCWEALYRGWLGGAAVELEGVGGDVVDREDFFGKG